MSFSDIFKTSFLENFTSVTILDMVLTMALAFAVGLFIFFVYKKTYAGVMYSASFGASIVALTMVTALVILAVTSNVVLSLGMVGALSIVRFRSAIKEPLEIVYLFWAVAAGIVIAAGLIPLAIFGSVVIGIALIVLVNRKPNWTPYIVVISCDDALGEKAAADYLKNCVSRAVIKSKTARAGLIELTYEVRLNDTDADFITALSALEHVTSAVLVSYNGDYMG